MPGSRLRRGIGKVRNRVRQLGCCCGELERTQRKSSRLLQKHLFVESALQPKVALRVERARANQFERVDACCPVPDD